MQAGSSLFLFGWMVEVDCLPPKNRSGFYELLRDFCTFAQRYRSYIPKILALCGTCILAFLAPFACHFVAAGCVGEDMIPAVF